MIWISAFLLTFAAGWFLARASTAALFGRAHPRAGAVGEAGLAVLFGPGLASILFFALNLAGVASTAAILAALALFTAAAGAWWWSTGRPEPAIVTGRTTFPWTWALLAGLVAAALMVALDFSAASTANPNGDWDATAIWNLRARFLAGGSGVWRRAISAEPGGFMARGSHPGYPLFLSSFLGMLWTLAGAFTTAVPVANSGAVACAVLALLTASLAARRSLGLGMLGGSVLLATELFASQSAVQYADLLLALAVLAALVLLDAAAGETQPAPNRLLVAAGLAIGFAPWIKNEGVPFAVAALAVAMWRFGLRGWLWVLLGSAPGLMATAALTTMAQGRESMFPNTAAEAFARLGDPSRWWQSLAGFGNALLQLGPWWAHPVLLMLFLAWALRPLPAAERRSRLWLWIPVAVVLAAEYGLFLVTNSDLSWQIGTAASRLVLQVWPGLIWLALTQLRTPEEYFPVAAPVVAAAPSSPRKKRAKD